MVYKFFFLKMNKFLFEKLSKKAKIIDKKNLLCFKYKIR